MREAIINSTNYEAWLLDFVEGRLSASEAELLRAFANAHPELNIDLQDLDLFYFEPDSKLSLDIKSELKKDELSIETTDEILIEALEDETQINKAEQLLLDYPNLILDFEAYKKTKLKADLAITFTNKIGLKKSLVHNEKHELKIFEATEFGQNAISELSRLNESEFNLTKTIKAYQLARFTADNSIVFPDKKRLKKAIFFGIHRKTLYRVAAILIGISFFGGYLFTEYQKPNSNGLVAKNDTQAVNSIKKPVLFPKASEVNPLAVVDPKVASKSTNQSPKVNKKAKTTVNKTLNVLPEPKLMQEEINLAMNNTIQLEEGITVDPISAEDPIIVALEQKNELKKVNPTLVLEDKEEELTSTDNTTKDPLLYTTANRVNKVLGFITTKKIPVSKKKDKDKVSYSIGKDLLSYSTNKKMQP